MRRQIQTLYGSFQYNQCSEQYSLPWFLFAIEIKTLRELNFFPSRDEFNTNFQLFSTKTRFKKSLLMRNITMTPKQFFHEFLPNG